MLDKIAEEAKKIVGEGYVVSDPRILEPYLYDKTEPHVRPKPAREVILIKPGSVEEVSEIVKLAYNEGVAVFPRGGGTGLAGGAIPTKPGIILSLERLNRLSIDRENMVADAEAGVTLGRLIEESEKFGLYFPPHPGDEGAQIGGLIACNAGGSRALRHGSMRSSVLGMQVVLPNGELVNVGNKTIKNNMASNFLHLFIGSEGSLGIIVRSFLRLYPKPMHSATILVPYGNVEKAVDSAMKMLWAGYVPLSLELVDSRSMKRTAEYLGLGWKYGEGEAFLMVVVSEPNKDMLYAEIEGISAILYEGASGEPILAERKEEQDEILKIRSEIYSAYEKNLFEGLDVSVPIGEAIRFIDSLKKIEEKYGIKFPIVAHLGDGTFHPDILMDSLDREKLIKVREEVYEAAVYLGGSITGEHGIGYTRKPYADKYMDDGLKRLMIAVKRTIDERGIMNPEKFVP